MHPLSAIVRNPRQAAALGAGMAAVLSVAVYAVFRKRPTVEELEARRRDHLAATGRITDGSLIDAVPSVSDPRTIVYQYRIAGVEYRCSQDISSLIGTGDVRLPALYARDNPGDSIVLAASWNGLWSIETGLPHSDPRAADVFEAEEANREDQSSSNNPDLH